MSLRCFLSFCNTITILLTNNYVLDIFCKLCKTPAKKDIWHKQFLKWKKMYGICFDIDDLQKITLYYMYTFSTDNGPCILCTRVTTFSLLLWGTMGNWTNVIKISSVLRENRVSQFWRVNLFVTIGKAGSRRV